MSEPINVYVGWDEKDAQAYEVCRKSLLERASIPVNVIPLKHYELRSKKLFSRGTLTMGDGQMFDMLDQRPCSTTFSFTRFLVPYLEDYGDKKAIFIDPDVMWRCDIKELLAACTEDKAVWCVKHDHEPTEGHKFDTNVIQTKYRRKNWSSLMVFNPSRCAGLSLYAVNYWKGSHLHAMLWVHEDEIGSLPEEYNWLEGHSPPKLAPKILHYTRGTPDMVPGLIFEDEWWGYAKENAPGPEKAGREEGSEREGQEAVRLRDDEEEEIDLDALRRALNV